MAARHAVLALALALFAGGALAKPFVCKIEDVPQCMACNDRGTKCIACALGYRPAGNGKSCVKCGQDSGALAQFCVCSTKGNPKKCGTCVDPEVDPLKQKKLYVDSKGNCKECPVGCTACKGPNGKCEGGCKPGYFKKGNACVDCTTVANCLACEEKKQGSLKCKTCAEGFMLASNKKACLACTPGCGKCSQSGPPSNKVTKCNSCAAGFLAVREQGKIKQCLDCGVPNCAECSVVGTCTVCAPGYLVNAEGKCDSCAFTACEVCTAPGTCQACSEGFRLPNPPDALETGRCIACGAGCAACQLDGKCDECLDDYAPNATDNKICDSTED